MAPAANYRSGFWILLAIFLFVCLSGHSVSAQSRRPKNVQVALRSKWSGTPLLLEAGELLSKEWTNLFWDFTEFWLRSASEDSDSSTAKDCLKKIVNYGKSVLSESLASIFEFSLTLRSSSPRLVLYRQLAEDSLSSFPVIDDISSESVSEPSSTIKSKTEPLAFGASPRAPNWKCCWVDIGSSIYFDVTELQQWLQSSNNGPGDAFQQPELFEFDHVHPDSSTGSPVTILYGALGSYCFKEFHVALVDAAKQGKITYVVRPLLASGCESKIGTCGAVGTRDPLNLGGYGVELALKNMEYKAMDDSTIKKEIR